MTRAHALLCEWLHARNVEYRLGQPTVSDHQFDMAFRALEYLERADPSLRTSASPTQRVG